MAETRGVASRAPGLREDDPDGGSRPAGFRYLTDEAAFVDPTTRILRPFPRPLWMELGTVEIIPGVRDKLPAFSQGARLNYHVAPNDLRSRSIGSPCRIRLIVAPTYVRGASTRLEPLSRAEGLVVLAGNSFNAAKGGKAAVELLADVVAGAECFRLVMGDLRSAVETVSALVKQGDG